MLKFLQNKPILTFVLKAGAIYLLLALLAGPLGLKKGYASFFQSVATKMYGDFGDDGLAKFESFLDQGKEILGFDTKISVTDREVGLKLKKEERHRINAAKLGLFPSILLCALIIASPLPWKRKIWTVLAGLAVIQLIFFMLMKIKVEFMLFELRDKVNLPANEAWGSTMGFLHELLITNITILTILPVVIWAIVAFNRNDLAKMQQVFAKQG